MIVTTDNRHYADIASAIREKTGTATTYKPEQMAAGVGEVYAAGIAAGGGGSIANILQYVSSSGNIDRLFCRADFKGTDEINIKIPDCPADLSEMFTFVVGLRKVTLDIPTTKAYDGYRFLYGGGAATDVGTSVEELVLPDGIKFSNFTNFARNAPNLETIKGKIDLSECEIYPNPFQKCASLENVAFMEESIPFSISFANSPNLSDASIKSIIKGLVDLTGQERQTLGFHSSVLANLSDEQFDAIEEKNWGL